MIGRYVYKALERGLAAYASTPALYDDLFGGVWDLTDEEVAGVRDYFTAHPPQIRHGYQLAAIEDEPTFFIYLTGEEQPEHALGDAGGAAGAGATSGGVAVGSAQTDGALFDSNYVISCVAPGSIEVAMYMFELARSIMLAAKHYLQKVHRLDLMSYGGSDAEPDTSHSPDILYIRNLTMRCRREFTQLDSQSTLEQFFAVDGIALPPGTDNETEPYLALTETFQVIGGRVD